MPFTSTPAPVHTLKFSRISFAVVSTEEGKSAPLIVIFSVGPLAMTGQPNACQLVHEPFVEGLAEHQTGRAVRRPYHELRGRFRDSQSRQSGRGTELDAAGGSTHGGHPE